MPFRSVLRIVLAVVVGIQHIFHAIGHVIHAVDVEGKASGIEVPLVELLADMDNFPCTYAGGVGSFEDLTRLKQAGRGKVDVTIGSALDLFGGKMPYREVLEYIKKAAD